MASLVPIFRANKCPTALCTDKLFQISPKSAINVECMGGNSFILVSDA
jgi:hypothetical protein